MMRSFSGMLVHIQVSVILTFLHVLTVELLICFAVVSSYVQLRRLNEAHSLISLGTGKLEENARKKW